MSESGPDRSLETRVEDLFSNAVERQVAERRAVGRALEELGQLVKALDDRVARVEDAEAERDRDLRAALDGLVARVTAMSEGVGSSLQGDVAGLGRDLDERLSRLEAADQARDLELRDAVGSITDHVDAMTGRFRDVLAEGVDLLGQRQADTAASLERAVAAAAAEQSGIDPEALAERVAARVVSQSPPLDVGVVADAVQGRVPTALQVASAVDASIRDGLVSVVDDIRAEVDRLRDELGVLRDEVSHTAAGLQPLSSRLGDELDELVDAVHGMRNELRSEADHREHLLEVVRAEVGDAGSAPDRVVEVVQRELSNHVGEALAGVDRRVGELDGVRDELREQVGVVRERFEFFATQMDAIRDMTTAVGTQSAQMDRLAVELPAAVTSAVDERGEKLSDDLRALVGELAAELGTAVARVAERVEEAQSAAGEKLDTVEEHVASVDEVLAALREDVDRDTESLAAQSETLEGMAEDVAGLGATIGRVMGEVQADLEGNQDEVFDRLQKVLEQARDHVELSLSQGRADLEEALEAVRSQVEAATGALDEQADAVVERLDGATEVVVAASDGLRAKLEDALDDIASATRIDAEAARDEVVAASARLDLLFDRLAGFERAIVDHLQSRDAQLTRERQLVTEALAEQLVTAISRGQRKRLARNLDVPSVGGGSAAAAPRIEAATPPPGSRDLDVDPGRRLSASDADEPVASALPDRGRDAAPTAQQAPTEEAPARKAPARQAPTRKASARKAPARKAPAKTAPARRVTRQDLAAVRGLGPAKVDALVEALGSPDAVAEASVEQLAAVPGISERLARTIHDGLR